MAASLIVEFRATIKSAPYHVDTLHACPGLQMSCIFQINGSFSQSNSHNYMRQVKSDCSTVK